jgi:oligopeptidase A
MGNPLLEKKPLPAFSLIKPEHIVPAIDEILADNKKQIEALISRLNEPTWANFIETLDDLNDRLAQSWSPVSHMNAVVNSDALRDAYNQCLTKLSEYSTEIGHNIGLYKLYEKLRNSKLYPSLNVAQKTVIDNALRDFKLSGIALNEKDKTTFGELQKRLAELTSKFAENVLDATQGWTKQIESIEELRGVPNTALAVFEKAARDKDIMGFLITLEMPSYLPIMMYADDRALRKEVYEAYVTRASDLGPTAGKWDNSQIMK